MAHQLSNSDPRAIVERAFDVLLAEVLKEKAGITNKPRAGKPARHPGKREIPAPLRREVWTRDQARCAFVSDGGQRCDETRALEFAHLKPWGKGGEHSARNLAHRCPADNAFEAERDYGASHMASKRKRKALS